MIGSNGMALLQEEDSIDFLFKEFYYVIFFNILIRKNHGKEKIFFY